MARSASSQFKSRELVMHSELAHNLLRIMVQDLLQSMKMKGWKKLIFKLFQCPSIHGRMVQTLKTSSIYPIFTRSIQSEILQYHVHSIHILIIFHVIICPFNIDLPTTTFSSLFYKLSR